MSENTFYVPIGNEKNTEVTQFHTLVPELRYIQVYNNACCFSSLSSALHLEVSLLQNRILICIEE